MNRKDLFKKFFQKSIHLTLETIDEIQINIHEAIKPIIENPSIDKEKQTTKEEPSLPLQKNLTDRIKKNKKKSIFRGLQPPPGHIRPIQKFQDTCTGCGDCVFACPYNAIFPVYNEKKGKNFPYLDVNANACHLCEDWPCIQSCNFGALKPFNNGKVRKMGRAKGLFEYCINNQTGEKTCNACEEACPIDKTVIFRRNKPTFAESCVGCGLCVQACPTYPKSIRIF